MAKYAYEYGKRWDVRVPRFHLGWLMGRTHVGAPDAEIAANIEERCVKSDFPAVVTRQSVAYALECHHRNQALVRRYRL